MESKIEDYDSINLDLEVDSTYVTQTDNYFYFKNKSKIYEANECGIINTYDLPEQCNCVFKNNKNIYFSSRNKLYKLLTDNTFGEKKFRQRILGFIPLDCGYSLLALICKKYKLLQLQIHTNTINLEKYSEKCNASILFLDLVDENLILCVYKTESIIKYCTVGLNGTDIALLRKGLLSTDVNIKFDCSLSKNYFLLTSDNGFSILRLNKYNCSLESILSKDASHHSDSLCNDPAGPNDNGLNLLSHSFVKYHKFDSSLGYNGSEFIKLVNDHILCVFKLGRDYLTLDFYDVNSKAVFKSINLSSFSQPDCRPKKVVSVLYSRGIFTILVELEDSKYNILSFNHEIPTESISYYDPYEKIPSREELEKLIESSEIIITAKLVDYLISNNIKSLCKKILKCVHLPETEAVKILKNDLTLMDDFILYTRCSESELKRAFKEQIDSLAFKNILYKLFEMMEEYYSNHLVNEVSRNNRAEDGNHVVSMDLDYYRSDGKDYENRIMVEKVIKMINILLDAKVIEVEQFDEQILQGLQNMVEGCQKEQMDLQSLLSFTNTLLDNKFKLNTNPLITSIEISLD